MMEQFRQAFEAGLKKAEWQKANLDGFPHITKDAKWLTNQNGHWTGGFWTGTLWLDSLDKADDSLKAEAKEWALRLRCRMDDCTTHDQGFIFGPSCVMGYRITKDEDFLPLIHAGAVNMIRQYVPEVGLVQAWAESGYDGISIVDTIMNLPILWISGELLDDPTRKELSIKIAKNIARYAIRKDYSSYHVVKWDKNYRISGDTHQGFAAESCWSRGQAWALYGFANMYRYTGQIEFLEQAVGLADYYWAHLNDNRLPAWDFTFQNDETAPIDASASSIAASGMALISGLLAQRNEGEQAALWGNRADEILEKETEFCLYKTMDRYGIIEHAVVDFPHKSGIDESAQYGDYYYMEALYRRLNKDNAEAIKLLY